METDIKQIDTQYKEQAHRTWRKFRTRSYIVIALCVLMLWLPLFTNWDAGIWYVLCFLVLIFAVLLPFQSLMQKDLEHQRFINELLRYENLSMKIEKWKREHGSL